MVLRHHPFKGKHLTSQVAEAGEDAVPEVTFGTRDRASTVALTF